MANTPVTERLPHALLALRLGVFIVMIFWTLDKFVAPEHAAAVWGNFYLIRGLGPPAFYVIGAAQLILVLAFVAGLYKRLTYGLVFVLHGISTLASWQQYLNPFENLLFFAAWPMLAACFALYVLRDGDTLWTVRLGEERQR
ncbi:MAG: hypothetical protein ACNA7W_20895 [Pseudomonadales bacterium]